MEGKAFVDDYIRTHEQVCVMCQCIVHMCIFTSFVKCSVNSSVHVCECVSVTTYLVSMYVYLNCNQCPHPSGGGLSHSVLGDQAGRPGCLCQLQTPHHSEGVLQQTALSRTAWSDIRRPWSEERFQGH